MKAISVKICGLMRTEDVMASVELGADAVGFILARGKRQVTTDFVASFADRLPSEVLRVGVVINPSLQEALKLADQAKLGALQLHGGESVDFITDLRRERPRLKIIKALAVDTKLDGRAIEIYQNLVDHLLFDSPKGESSQKLDIKVLERALAPIGTRPEFWVAGGLTPETVALHVRESGAGGVDVASGVEETVGKKSRAAIAEFIRSAKGVVR